MAQVGRISGPLLTANLERQGRNLKFRNTLDTTPVLWLDVNTGTIGVNYNGEPLAELYTQGTAKFQDVISTNTARFNNWLISQNSISPDVGSIYLNSSGTINLTGLGTEGLIAQNNHIKTTQSNSNLELSPNGSGTVEIFSNTRIEGNLYATGNITADGNLTLGTGDEDSIIINAELTVPLVPAQDGVYNLGSSEKPFREIYAPLLNGQTISVSQIAAGTLSNLGQRAGNIFYVAVNGDDTNVGDHPTGPFRTIKRALNAADASLGGPVTIHIFPGTYEEELPLVVPTNVTVSGEDLRNVVIKPAIGYQDNDVFLLNGETTVQNLTIQDTHTIEREETFRYIIINTTVSYGASVNTYFSQYFDLSDTYAIVWCNNDYITIYNVNTGLKVYTKYATPQVYAVSISENYFIYNQNGTVRLFSTATGNELDSFASNSVYRTPSMTDEFFVYRTNNNEFDVYDLTQGLFNFQFTITNPDNYNFGWGNTCEIYENYILCGSPNYTDTFISEGRIYLYDLNTQQFVLNIAMPEPELNSKFGQSVAITKDYLIASSATDKIYIFDKTTGNYLRKIEYPDINNFGYSIDANDEYVIAGGLSDTKVAVFKIATGELIKELTVDDYRHFYSVDSFGQIVKMSASKILVNDLSAVNNRGHLYVYDTEMLKSINYAFKFAKNAVITSRSPYIQNCSITNKKQIYLSYEIGENSYYQSVSNLFIEVPFDAKNITVDSVDIRGGFANVGANIAINGNQYTTGINSSEYQNFTWIGAQPQRSTNFVNQTQSLFFSFTDTNLQGSNLPNHYLWQIKINIRFDSNEYFDKNNENLAKGILVDGADVDSNSNEAGMLFHSCTFITPYSDGLVATNGARVEWLNSFTYFANRGIYAYNGTTGHLSSDGSTIKYGAEIRSIGSACVYGNYGIVGDGSEVLVYAINHNLAYIGAGTSATNDDTQVNIDNEIVKYNDAKIYYQTQDHTGDYRVGDNFLVDFGSGLTNFVFGTGIVDFSGEVDPNTGEVEDYNSVIIENTLLNPNRITVGDFRISGNTIETLNQTFTFDSSNQHNFLANTQTINIETNNLTLNSNTVYHGVDHDFLSRVQGNISPTTSSLFNLGSSSYRWRKGYFDEATIGDISFNTNYISTNISNSDLELKAYTNKKVNVIGTDTHITNNLQVQGTSTTKNITTNTYIGTGNWTVNDSYTVNNNFYSTYLDVGLQIYTDDITIEQNNISTTLSNSDLTLRAAGTGNILFENLHIENNLDLNNLFVNNTYFSLLRADLSTNNIDIYQNVIETTLSNSDLEFRAFENKSVVVQDISFNDNIINATTDSLFLPVDFLDMSGNNAGLILNRGTTAERNNINGTIRYNTQTSSFEGWYNVNQNFGGLISENAQTKIIITDNNVISLFVAGNYLGNFEPTKMNIHSLTVDNINLNGNTISSANNNLELIPNNGITEIEGLEVVDETITNGINRPLIFANTNNGFYKFDGTIGIQIPFGTVLERPSGLLGQLRFNTDDTLLEVYDGTDWIDAEGFIEPISQDEADLLNFEASLILG